MQDLLQRAFLFRVNKHYRAHLGSIQVTACRKNRGPKFASNQLSDLRIFLGQIVRSLVRIKKCRGGNDLAQTFTENRLPCGNSTGNSDDWHISGRDTPPKRYLVTVYYSAPLLVSR